MLFLYPIRDIDAKYGEFAETLEWFKWMIWHKPKRAILYVLYVLIMQNWRVCTAIVPYFKNGCLRADWNDVTKLLISSAFMCKREQHFA